MSMRAAIIRATRWPTSADVATRDKKSSDRRRTRTASRTTTAVCERPPLIRRAASPNDTPGPASATITGPSPRSAKKRTRPEMIEYVASGTSPWVNRRTPAGTESHSAASRSAAPASPSNSSIRASSTAASGGGGRAVRHSFTLRS